jgi:hypothetical protein
MRFIEKMGGLIVYYPNKYIMISVDSTDSIQARNLQSRRYVDWIDETYNGRGFQICPAKPNILILSLLWISSLNLNEV